MSSLRGGHTRNQLSTVMRYKDKCSIRPSTWLRFDAGRFPVETSSYFLMVPSLTHSPLAFLYRQKPQPLIARFTIALAAPVGDS